MDQSALRREIRGELQPGFPLSSRTGICGRLDKPNARLPGAAWSPWARKHHDRRGVWLDLDDPGSRPLPSDSAMQR